MKKIIRVFPSRTNATPDDEDVRIGDTPTMFDQADEVHISVSFSWDLPKADWLAKQWRVVAPVKIGGPATGQRSEEFIPGMYIKKGYTITSRGCPNKCWFCSVWRREGEVRELEIKDGWNVLDDNLLACSDSHIKSVFNMLQRQEHRPRFTGGLEAKRLLPWMAQELRSLNPETLYFAYDTPDDLEPLQEASKTMQEAGFKPSSHSVGCYVLIGFPKDSIEDADSRLRTVINLGMMPMAMLWRDKEGKRDSKWMRFARQWARPSIVFSKQKKTKGE